MMNVKDRIKKLENQCYSMEMSDDRLFTNGNGNLPRYNALQEEIAVLLRKYRRYKVQCIETAEIFDSAAAAAAAIGCGRSAMANHLAKRFPTVRGKRFRRIDG